MVIPHMDFRHYYLPKLPLIIFIIPAFKGLAFIFSRFFKLNYRGEFEYINSILGHEVLNYIS